eukprot:GHVS01066155.1.p1 GENE.GHVS01066155.1~~GHVS01066155.1.p1  ORF type:complete len:865 (+),score=118.82 GHVS01066155.1:337-2931(+)
MVAGRVFVVLLLTLFTFCMCQDRRAWKNVSNTILVTYNHECLQESTRVSLVGRSVREAVRSSARSAASVDSRELPTIRRSSLKEDHLGVSSTFSFGKSSFSGAKKEEREGGGCRVREQWLKHIGLQLISLEGECERVGKDALLGSLGQEHCVQSREIDSIRYPTGDLAEPHTRHVPNDPDYHRQWHLDDTNPFSVQAQAAWGISRGGNGSVEEQPGNTVGIVDFGFMQSHPDLEANWWTNPREVCEGEEGGNGEDEDNNGFTDDCRGWNMDSNSNDLSGYSHGTKVAGCIAAVADNGVGISGICPMCRMLPTTVAGSVSSELAGCNYILSKGIRVINLSVGGPRSTAEYNTFKQNQHALFIVAAGNEGCNLDRIDAVDAPVPCLDQYGSSAGFPASLSSELMNVVSVGSITRTGNISSFSSIGATRVQVFAPGSEIYTTTVSGGSPRYSSRSGTSYAAPIVAGVAGLVLQRYPLLSACQLREALIQGCIENPDLEGKAECNGQLSAYRALQEGKRISLNLSLYACEDGFRTPLDIQRSASAFAGVKKTPVGGGGSVVDISTGGTDGGKEVIGTKAGLRKVGTGSKVTVKMPLTAGEKPSHGTVLTKGTVPAAETVATKPGSKVATAQVSAIGGALKKPIKVAHGMQPVQEGEDFLEAMVAAIAKSGILVNAGMLEVTVSLLLKLFSNIVDPLAIMTEGIPVRKYLHDFEKRLSLEPVYGDINGLSRGPITLLLNPLSHAKDFLSSTQLQTQKAPKNGSFSLDFGLGVNIVEPLVFGKMMAMELLNLNDGIFNSTTGDGLSDLLSDPLQLWVLRKQLKQLKKDMLVNPFELVHSTTMQFGEKLLHLSVGRSTEDEESNNTDEASS